jgi:hypothetical protein
MILLRKPKEKEVDKEKIAEEKPKEQKEGSPVKAKNDDLVQG